MGDFNFPTINWAESYCTGSDSSAASTFFDTVQDSFLVQHVASSRAAHVFSTPMSFRTRCFLEEQ